MKISRSTGYAFVAVGYIAEHSQKGAVLAAKISKEYNIPLEYLFKILQQLVRANVLRSKRGPRGGFFLARPAENITMLEVIEAVDGPLVKQPHLAEQANNAPFSIKIEQIYQTAANSVRTIFGNACLQEILALPTISGDAIMAREAEEIVINTAFNKPFIVTGEGPSPEPKPPQSYRYPVWYCTDRKPKKETDLSKGFTNKRDPSEKEYYGKCEVIIPKSHQLGSLGSHWLERLITHKDKPLKIDKRIPLLEEAYWKSIENSLIDLGTNERTVLVFVHGFNVDFDEAALRAAQLGVDLKVPLTAFYSWPSKGTPKPRAYIADGETVKVSQRKITNFLIKLSKLANAERVHIIAHSMGNRPLLHAMQQIAQDAQAAAEIPFGQILLAAPDVDRDLFMQLASAYNHVSDRTTLYASEKDSALELSGVISMDSRAGFVPPITIVDGVDTVDVSDVDFSFLGHGYYAAARDVLQDIHELINNNTPPKKRFALEVLSSDEGEYWKFK